MLMLVHTRHNDNLTVVSMSDLGLIEAIPLLLFPSLACD